MRISYSSLETFLQCPLKFKYQEIDKIKTPKSKDALFGTAVHEALRMLHNPSMLTPPSEKDFLDFFSSKWDPTIFQTPQEDVAYFGQGIKILKDYYAKNYPANFNVLDLETRFEVSLEHKNEIHLVTGKIDRIDKIDGNAFEVIDYKTAKKMPSQSSVEENLQLSIYHLGLLSRWPKIKDENRAVTTSLYFLKHGEKLSVQKTNEDLEATKEQILTTIDSIKGSDFKPKAGPLCPWCGYQAMCPLWKHKFKKENVKIEDAKIKEMIKEYNEIKSHADKDKCRMVEIKATVNQYLDAEGIERVFTDDGEFLGRTLKKIYAYDIELLRQILEPLGIWQEILSLDDKKLKKAVAGLPYAVRQKIEQTRKLEKEFKVMQSGREKVSR